MSKESISNLLEKLKSLDSHENFNPETLGPIFDTCLLLNDVIENSDLPSNEKLYQDAVKTCIESLERCTHMVNELSLFSSNETIEEVQTSSLRYLMLPAVLGNLILAQQSKELSERFRILEIAEVYFRDFLLRCKNYELSKRNLINRYENELLGDDDLDDTFRKQTALDLAAIRENKIQQYKLRKELKDRENDLKPALERQDEELIREYYLVILERWMLTAIEELNNIKSEKSVLGSMMEKKDSPRSTVPPKRDIKPLKPIIITRNEIQKKIFGLGYPSLPVMTIEDFYQQRFQKMVKEHKNNSEKSLQDRAMMGGGNFDKEAEEIEKETLLEKDDFEALQKARAWDDWKDDNPRGSGNRKNKG